MAESNFPEAVEAIVEVPKGAGINMNLTESKPYKT